jgi:hypothetical protein
MIQGAYQNYGGSYAGNYGVYHAGAMKPDTKRAESASQTSNAEGDQVHLSDEALLVTRLTPRGTALVN